MKIYDHEFCRSGQCIWQQWGIARLTIREITDMQNYIKGKQRERELESEARRLYDEHEIHFEKAEEPPVEIWTPTRETRNTAMTTPP